MNICLFLADYVQDDIITAKQIRQARHLSNADMVVCIMNKYISNNGIILCDDIEIRKEYPIDNGVDLIIVNPTIFSLSKKQTYLQSIILVMKNLGLNNKYYLMGLISSEELDDINMAKDMLSSQYNDSFLSNNVMKISQPQNHAPTQIDISNMLTNPRNNLIVAISEECKRINIDCEIIPINEEKNIDYIKNKINGDKLKLIQKQLLPKLTNDELKNLVDIVSNSTNINTDVLNKITFLKLSQIDISNKEIITMLFTYKSLQFIFMRPKCKKIISKDSFCTKHDNKKWDELDQKVSNIINYLKQ